MAAMSGNGTSDWYVPATPTRSLNSAAAPVNPRVDSKEKSYHPAQPQFRIPRKVGKGGSNRCAPHYVALPSAARQAQMMIPE